MKEWTIQSKKKKKEYKKFTKGSIFRPIFSIFLFPFRSSRCTFAKRCQCIDGGLKRAFLAGQNDARNSQTVFYGNRQLSLLSWNLSWNRAEQAWSRLSSTEIILKEQKRRKKNGSRNECKEFSNLSIQNWM